MCPSERNLSKHPWYKRKGYLHFDYALNQFEAERYVTNPNNIISHRFSPLIHYLKPSVKVKRDKKAEELYKISKKEIHKPRLLVKRKYRKIFYTSHIDGYIYSYYSFLLQNSYDRFLENHNLLNNVIAHRSIQKNGIKYCNSQLAKEAFDFIKSTNGCKIICFDLSKFFDNLDPKTLKEKWTQIVGEERLPQDHYKVYKSLVEFSYVEEGQIIQNFQKKFKISPRLHGLESTGGSFKNTICNYKELRDIHNKYKTNEKRFIKYKTEAKIKGVAQGTAISGLLSNLFMIDFDIKMKKYIEDMSGCYMRYSDDIFVAFPEDIDFSHIEQYLVNELKVCCANSVKLNETKTEYYHYTLENENKPEIRNRKEVLTKVQYLGFHFDGLNTYLRTSSVSKTRGKTIQEIRKYKKRNGKMNTVPIYKSRSRRKITIHDRINKKGFVYYAERAATTHDQSETIKQQMNKNDRFLRRAIKRERLRKPKFGSSL